MELVIDKQRYYVPEKWNEVSLKRYIDFHNTYKEDVSDAEKEIHLVSTLTGAPYELLGKAKKSVINKVTSKLTELITTKCNEDLVLEFTIDGTDYGFHPNLSQMKLKEFVDLDNKLENEWRDMHKIMAILYRPITVRKKEKYDIEEYNFMTAATRAELFLNTMTIDVVNAAAAFFLRIALDYMKITQVYSKMNRRSRRAATKAMHKSLRRNMGGMV